MQDHEDFILFRQKINLMMESLGEKIVLSKEGDKYVQEI